MTADQAKRTLRSGAYEALDWLRSDTHQVSTIGDFGFVESVGAMRRGYAAGAKRIHVYEVYCRMDTGLPFSHQILVELPAEQPARERVFAWARSLGASRTTTGGRSSWPCGCPVREERPMSENAEFIYSADGQRRVVILRLAAGQYSYREEYHYHPEAAEGWVSLGSRASYYDSLETARREIVFNVPWLSAERAIARSSSSEASDHQTCP